ncbi:MAG: ribonuclease HII [Lachnospiraceae bacterium]|nr:ribonuclease HII [Lachnospiraceae bacterium]
MSPEKLRAELQRLRAMKEYEYGFLSVSNAVIAGVDEAGRGPLAGPVVAAAAILDMDDDFIYLNDSKKVTPKRRDVLYDEIMNRAICGIGIVSAKEIDEINILQATYKAMREAINNLSERPTVLLNDAVIIPGIEESIHQEKIIKGDAKSVSIAAASILAKVTRDRYMEELGRKYPDYGFEKHKGYGTKAHIEAIKKFGITPEHRKTFLKNITGA